MIEACAGGDRRKLAVTVSAQVMTDEGKGGWGICKGITGAERGTGDMYRG